MQTLLKASGNMAALASFETGARRSSWGAGADDHCPGGGRLRDDAVGRLSLEAELAAGGIDVVPLLATQGGGDPGPF